MPRSLCDSAVRNQGRNQGRAVGLAAGLLAVAGTLALAPAPAPVTAPASRSDLRLVQAAADPAVPGGQTLLRALVANGGPDVTASPFTVTVLLPPHTTDLGGDFPSSCADSAAGTTVSCTFPPGLPQLRTAIVEIRLLVGGDVRPGTVLSGGGVTVASPDGPSCDHRPYSIQVR